MEASTAGRSTAQVRRLVLVGLALLALGGIVAAATVFINRGPLPERWRAAAAAGLSEWLGAEVSVGSARLAGPGRIVLEDVGAEGADGAVSLHVQRVTAGFSVWELGRLVQAPFEAVRWVQLHGLELHVPQAWLAQQLERAGPGTVVEPAAVTGPGEETRPTPSDTGRQWPLELVEGRVEVAGEGAPLVATVNGRVTVAGDQWTLHGLQVSVPGLTVTGRGNVWPQPDLHVQIAADDLAAAVRELPAAWRSALPVDLAGKTAGELWLQGPWPALRSWGRVQLEGLTVALRGVAQRPYALTGGTFAWSYWPGRGLELSLLAERGATRLRVEGTAAADGAVDLTVAATDLELPQDVAIAARWRASGRADFLGRLSGTWRDPVLTGELAADGGRLFDQPFSALSGDLRLSRSEFAFERVRISQGLSEYFLDGRVALGTETGNPGELHLVVRTDRGRVEALTAAVGWDVPVEAALSGTLVLGGPLGAVSGQGDVVLMHGVAWGQAFDRLAGQFHYGPDGFEIPEATGSVRGGTVHVRGGGQPAGPWELAVSVQDVPVHAVAGLRESLPMVSGLVSFDGTVSRAAGDPLPGFAGRLSARHLRIGGLDFAAAEGPVEFRGGSLRTDGVTLRRSSGGTYVAAGVVRDAAGAPQLDLDVAVAGESLADVLALTGLRLPVLAPSGRVEAQVVLQGTLDRPDARIRLDAPNVYVIGYRTGVAVELRIRDGRVEVEELARTG